MRKQLIREIRKTRSAVQDKKAIDGTKEKFDQLSVDEVEDVLVRFAWCRGFAAAKKSRPDANTEDGGNSAPEFPENGYREEGGEDDPVQTFYLKSTIPPMKLQLSFSSFSQPVETALFSENGAGGGFPDDEELPAGLLAYNTLMSVPIDARSVCMSRIIVVGGPSGMPGLKKRIVDEVSSLCRERDAASSPRSHPNPVFAQETPAMNSPAQKTTDQDDTSETWEDARDSPSSTLPAAFAEQEVDNITEQFRRAAAKESKPFMQGSPRGIESLGAWSGASLIAAMKIKGVVEVEKDKFLQHGLAGASKDARYGVLPSRTATVKAGAGDRSSWTLGVWA